MNATTKRIKRRRPNMRRAVVLFPSGLTLANLFFGIFAIVAASRLDFVKAGVYVMIGGICDALDGRVARAANAGSQFGEELDSLVDAITFGLAPAMIMFFAVLNRDGWDWVWVFLYVACAVMRLARFNIEQAGTAKTYFHGLPSPAAGITLASYYWFSQSWMYSYGAVGNLPWHVMLRFLMGALAALMISNVPYPIFPRTGYRSLRAILATIFMITLFVCFVTGKLEYFFPLSLIYIAWGLARWIFFNLFERRQPTVPYDLSEGEDEEDDVYEVFESEDTIAPDVTEREKRPAREERSRGAREGKERPAATERPARPARAAATAAVAAPERADRPAAPERTEEERAARREKRDKREKRERAPRADRSLETSEPATAPLAGAESASPSDVADVDVIGIEPTGTGASPLDSAGTDAEPQPSDAAPRKRKRRRRRGERKERTPGSIDGADADGGGDDSAGDERDDDGGEDHGDDRSAYSDDLAAPRASAVPQAPTPPAPESQAPAPPSSPRMVPPLPTSFESPE